MCFRNVRIIAKFEIMRKVRTKIFFIFMFLFPVITGGFSLVPSLFAGSSGNQVIQSYAFSSVFLPAVVAVLFLFMLILFSGGELVRSILEEKTSRIMEVLLSSCTPQELLMGKVIGLGVSGLIQISSWCLFAWLLVSSGIVKSEMFSNSLLSAVYFITGYLFYTSIFIGAGAVVNSEQQAQNFTNILSIFMVLPLVISLKVIENPGLPLFRFFSWFPLTSPPVMLLRLKVQSPPPWEILATIIIMLLSVILVVNLSARLFSAGILLTGSPFRLSGIISRLGRSGK